MFWQFSFVSKYFFPSFGQFPFDAVLVQENLWKILRIFGQTWRHCRKHRHPNNPNSIGFNTPVIINKLRRRSLIAPGRKPNRTHSCQSGYSVQRAHWSMDWFQWPEMIGLCHRRWFVLCNGWCATHDCHQSWLNFFLFTDASSCLSTSICHSGHGRRTYAGG